MERKFIIIDNVSDHVGYNGEELTITDKHDNYFFTLTDKDGKEYYCGEEEIKEI